MHYIQTNLSKSASGIFCVPHFLENFLMAQSLESHLAEQGDIVHFLRNQQVGPNVYPGVPGEFSNWRDEQKAWAETCVLFNQSYHMAELMVEGPGAFEFLNGLGINSFKGFAVDKAKQFVPVTPYGHVIGDVILFYLAENQFNLVGRAPTLNWLMFHGEGRDDVTLTYDERTAARPDPENRRHYRYQVQGPNAAAVIEAATGKPAPELKFFNMCWMEIGGKRVRALRHGMAGQPGYELFGPWADRDAVHGALVEAGKAQKMALVGGRTYSSNTIESGWIPSPLPAVYTGELLQPYRAWLSTTHYEAKASVGGSYVPDSVEGYYLTPWDLGYGPFVKFDHDFIGREALEKMAAGPHRKKVTLALDNDSVTEVIYNQFTKGELRAKYMEFPSAVYSMHPFDRVEKDGTLIGLSTWIAYSANEGKMLTLAMVDESMAEPGTEVDFIWGEPDGGTSKPTVEKHKQVTIKAVVASVPYSEVARTSYAESWRTKAA
jgi:glycine cleavage system aminomethyltransferase T